jgi:hypothetical protein
MGFTCLTTSDVGRMFDNLVLLNLIIAEWLAYHLAFVVDEAEALGLVLHNDAVGCDRGPDYTG